MIYSSKHEKIYWIPVISIITAAAVILTVAYLIIIDSSGKIMQPGMLTVLAVFIGIALIKVLLEIKTFSRNGNELFVKGVFGKKLYLINNSVIAITSTGREKTIGLYHPGQDSREIVYGLLTISGAEKNARRLSRHLQIPYGETEMFKKLKRMGLHK